MHWSYISFVLNYQCNLFSHIIQGNVTYWGRDNMAANSRKAFSNAFFLMEMYELRLKFHEFVPKGPIDSIPALDQIMTWCWLGAKPLSEPVVA